MKKVLAFVLSAIILISAVPSVTVTAADYVYVDTTTYEFGFETDFENSGWSVIQDEGDLPVTQVFNGSTAYEEYGCMKLDGTNHSSNPTYSARLVSNYVNVHSNYATYISFFAKRTCGAAFQISVYDENGNSEGIYDTNTGKYPSVSSDNTWECFEFRIPAKFKGKSVKIRFSNMSLNALSSGDLYIDNFSVFVKKEYAAIKRVDLYDFVTPEYYNMPDYYAAVADSYKSWYRVDDIEWYKGEDGTKMSTTDIYRANKSYYALIRIEALTDNGYMFEWLGGTGLKSLNTVKINGSEEFVDKSKSFISASGKYLYLYTKPFTVIEPVRGFYFTVTTTTPYEGQDITPPTGYIDRVGAKLVSSKWVDEYGTTCSGVFEKGKTYYPVYVFEPSSQNRPFDTSNVRIITTGSRIYDLIPVNNVVTLECEGIIPAADPNYVYGVCSECDCEWYYDRYTKTLTISGNGAFVPDYNFDNDFNYYYADEVENVIFEGGITELSDGTCFEYPNLTSAVLVDSIEIIGNDCFEGCESLKYLYLPSGLKKVGDNSFRSLLVETLFLPDSLEQIDHYSFCYLPELTALYLPDSLEYLDEGVFSDCPKLTTVYMPAALSGVNKENDAFIGTYDGAKLKNLTIYGYSYTFAHRFAVENGFKFESRDGASDTYVAKGSPYFNEDTMFMQTLTDDDGVSISAYFNAEKPYGICELYFQKLYHNTLSYGEKFDDNGKNWKIKIDRPMGFYIQYNLVTEQITAVDENGKSILVTEAAGVKNDINGDGLVNNKDIIALFKYLSGDTVSVNTAALDVNGDGGVNNKDIIALFNLLSQ